MRCSTSSAVTRASHTPPGLHAAPSVPDTARAAVVDASGARSWRVADPALLPVEELVGVYDADGGLLGELRYAVGRFTGRAHCALCTLSHGTLKRRPEWDAFVARLAIPMQMLHRNEIDPALRPVIVGQLPCIAGRAGGEWHVLVGADDLRRCGSDVAAFERRLRQALSERHGPFREDRTG